MKTKSCKQKIDKIKINPNVILSQSHNSSGLTPGCRDLHLRSGSGSGQSPGVYGGQSHGHSNSPGVNGHGHGNGNGRATPQALFDETVSVRESGSERRVERERVGSGEYSSGYRDRGKS